MDRIFTYIFGFCSFLGFVWTIVTVNKTLNKIEPIKDQIQFYDEFSTIFLTLCGSILGLVIFFIFLVLYSSRKIRQLSTALMTLPLENRQLKQDINSQIFTNKSITDCMHNILHYYRNILYQIDHLLGQNKTSPDTCDKADFNTVYWAFDRFLLTLLANLSTCFNSITQDRCAACIKIINEEGRVRTFFRDPVSYRHRKKSDYNQDGTPFIYKVSDNSAFNRIIDTTVKKTTFFCDDLIRLEQSEEEYVNRNTEWRKLYKACAVVPIQSRFFNSKRIDNQSRVLGFLCVDNLKGGFETREVKDFLSGFGDILYNAFIKYGELAPIAVSKGVTNGRLQLYTHWNDSR